MKNKKPVAEVENVKTENKQLYLNPVVFYLPLALLVVAVAAAAWAYAKYANAAYVNGKPISRLEYIKNMEKQGGKQVLDRMVEETLIKDEAAKKGVKVDQGTIDAEIAKIDTQIKAQGMTLDQALAAQQMTKSDLIEQIRLQKMAEKLAPTPADITQSQIDDYINQNKDQFPKTATKEEMESTAKTQLLSQAKNAAFDKWFTDLKAKAKITIL